MGTFGLKDKGKETKGKQNPQEFSITPSFQTSQNPSQNTNPSSSFFNIKSVNNQSNSEENINDKCKSLFLFK
jgi:hypothetical protein